MSPNFTDNYFRNALAVLGRACFLQFPVRPLDRLVARAPLPGPVPCPVLPDVREAVFGALGCYNLGSYD